MRKSKSVEFSVPLGGGGEQRFKRITRTSTGVLPPITNDKYVVHYDFSDVDDDTATEEFRQLCQDLDKAGLQTEVRAGHGQSLLVFVRAPKELLGGMVYKSRVKDWLYGISSKQPDVGNRNHVVAGAYEAEDLLSVFHLVTWSKDLGCAGITPGSGKWERVKSVFPLHNDPANLALLKHLSKRIILKYEDLDFIRNLFGSKVAFYFAYMQTYLLFLFFPASTGVLAWLFLPKYSLAYAIVTLFGCTVFLEYWKILQTDLSIRWNVRGVGPSKENRPQYKYEKVYVDDTGRTRHYFPRWKFFLRQSLQIPFFFVSFIVLGTIITSVFAIQVLISETYEGPYKSWLEYLPTILLAVLMPYMNSFLEDIAAWLAEYENHRTEDGYETSLTMKMFALSFVANYLPILLVAFVYIPLGDTIVPWLTGLLQRLVGNRIYVDKDGFSRDPNRLRNEVIALTVTGQISDMFEEMIMPVVLMKLRDWYRALVSIFSNQLSFDDLSPDEPAERGFLEGVRRQAGLPSYNVNDDISEMVIQFGYLALFSSVWPLVSIGFVINNWIELRSDFLKICIEHQRPDPQRTDGIGPWIGSLDALAWMGSISTAAIVHMFGISAEEKASVSKTLLNQWFGEISWWSLPITIFVSEHIFILLRVLVRFLLHRIGSAQIRKERGERYVFRKKYLADLEAEANRRRALDVGAVERRKSIRLADTDLFWTRQVEQGASDGAGTALIKALRRGKAIEPGKKMD